MINYLSKKCPAGKIALVRLDFNTEDTWRMEASLPTIGLLLKNGNTVVVLSHRGRPKGFDPKLSLKKDASALGRMLGQEVRFIPDFDFKKVKKEISGAKKGALFVLENLRFLPGEEKNSAALARQLASLGDFYVNEAFAVSHRANASVAAITNFIPAYAGLELESEIKFLSAVAKKPKRPLVVILGGAKAYDKLGVMKYLKSKADAFLIGGGAANTLLALRGFDIGSSLAEIDPKHLDSLRVFAENKKILLPNDFVREKGRILDIGSKSIREYKKIISDAGTIFWSGPMGLIEKKKFAKGSVEIARAIARNTVALKIAGGGETVMFLKKHRLDSKFDFISTGGGALLDFLAGEKLPGIEALA